MNKYYQNCLSCLKGLYFLGKSKLQKFIRNRKRKNDLFSSNLFANDQEQPAKILSSEEIGNMINKQAIYAELHPNVNEYKIVKQSNDEEPEVETKKEENIQKIKSEIDGFEFEDVEDDNKLNSQEQEGEDKKKESIEDLKNAILEFNNA